MTPVTFDDFLAGIDETARSCTRIPMMTKTTGWCTTAFGTADRQGYSTCDRCFEDFKRACHESERNRWTFAGESEGECVMRLISQQNVCERTYRLDPNSDAYEPGAYISKNDGHTYVKKSCVVGRPKSAIPQVDYYRGHCGDNLGPRSTEARRQECVDDMIAQWEAGNDSPHPKT